jgi:hypothetical protein
MPGRIAKCCTVLIKDRCGKIYMTGNGGIKAESVSCGFN